MTAPAAVVASPGVRAAALPPPNPLIAERVDSTPWYAGMTLVEGIAGTRQGIESQSWVSTTLGGVFVGVDASLLYLDPLGSMASWVAAMCLERVRFLAEALDWLAGDPDQVAANAQTWANVAANTAAAADDLRAAVFREAPQWNSPAADRYRARAETEAVALQGYAEAAAAKASAVQLSGAVVLAVRTLVRDLIADFLATLVVRAPQWTAEVTLTLGGATPWVAAQISALAAKWAARIAGVVDELLRSMARLAVLVRHVDELTDGLSARPRGGQLTDAGPAARPGETTVPGTRDGGGVDILPPRSGRPDLPATSIQPQYLGETDPAVATRLFTRPSNGVRYLTPEEAEGFRVFVRDGRLYQTDGTLLDTGAAGSAPGTRAIFVMDRQGNLYVSASHAMGEFHHSSFLAGRPVAGAGEIVVENGRVTLLSNISGHYRPSPWLQQQVIDQLHAQGVPVGGITVETWM